MTVHKLSAGDGYTYLTRQVASADEPRPQGQSLADYYVARGNPPGVWLGKGAAQLGLAGSEVSEAQMKALFGEGHHPDRDALLAAGASPADTRLGAAYPSYADLAPYPTRVAQGVEDFTATYGRSPSATERNKIAAKEARRGRRAVAGYDLVFTPVKSVSLLWALGGSDVRRAVEEAHHEAVRDAIGWLETHAAFTRTGRGGAAQVDATGLVCTAFDHRDSRSGDPDLHTHVAVANKVCGVDGKWRSLDARNLYALGVAASERYNTRIEDRLARRLGTRFTERPGGVAGKRPVREVVGMPPELTGHFSRRRAAIETRYAELRHEYRERHGREPDRSTQLQLAQQATLETREGKGPARTLAKQVEDWTAEARDVFGERRLAGLAEACTDNLGPYAELDDDGVVSLAREVVRRVSAERSTWTIWNVHAETERTMRGLRFATPEAREAATARVVSEASGPNVAIRIAEPELIAEAPELVRASDGQSVFVPHGSARYTTSEVLLAEDRLLDRARSTDAPHVQPVVLEARLAVQEATSGVQLDPGQRDLVRAFATSPARVTVGIGPAGAGKTTAMKAFADTWAEECGRVVPLATSSKAAQVLGGELDARAENLHKFLHENSHGAESRGVDEWFRLRSGDVVLLDEAGMAGTLQLSRLVDLAEEAGATVRLLGDPAQLAAVDAGGALRLLEREVGAAHLTHLHRFADPAEGEATLLLRDGDEAAIDFYETRGRISAGPRDAMLEVAYENWAADMHAGRTSVLVAAATADVTALNTRARVERVAAGHGAADGTGLHDGNLAGVGDWVLTRSNARALGYGRGRWVHNGDTWRVTKQHADGSLSVRHLENRGTVRLPAEYVADSVELGYAVTAHRVQGSTTDTAHSLVTPEMTREALYVASTRGRTGTRWYVATEAGVDIDCHTEPDAPQTAREVLAGVLNRDGAELSARETVRRTLDEATALPTLITRYEHARQHAARDALPHAVEHLPEHARARVLHDRGATPLAQVLADAASRGAHPGRVLATAYEMDDMDTVRSPALVLATRISDHPVSLGIPTERPAAAPLPWLPAPDVGHPAWRDYLTARASLIHDRATELGSLAASYREAYAVTGADLGDAPETGTRRDTAYRMASAEQQRAAPVPRRPLRSGPPPRHPTGPPGPSLGGPSLGR